MNEAQTRKALIDPLLKKAGWDVADHSLVGATQQDSIRKMVGHFRHLLQVKDEAERQAEHLFQALLHQTFVEG